MAGDVQVFGGSSLHVWPCGHAQAIARTHAHTCPRPKSLLYNEGSGYLGPAPA
jgi:hypothetical protein